MANSKGWELLQTEYHLAPDQFYTGNPDVLSTTPPELLQPLQESWKTTKELRPNDFNGLKVAVSRLAVEGGNIKTHGYITDYFTLWGLPKVAPELFAEHEMNVIQNRANAPDALYETTLPWGICTHNVLLDKNGDALMMIRSINQGFQAGRVSITEEEQMDPDRDCDPFNAAYTSFWEELGIFISPRTIRLLGVAVEEGAAYPAFCFIANTDLTAGTVAERWKKASDYNENTSLFAVPMVDIDGWAKDKIVPEVWSKHYLAGKIEPNAILSPHATTPWRIALAKAYTKGG